MSTRSYFEDPNCDANVSQYGDCGKGQYELDNVKDYTQYAHEAAERAFQSSLASAASAVQAAGSASAANNSAGDAAESANQAQGFANNAASSADIAANAADVTTQLNKEAQEAAAAAKVSEENAYASETASKTSEDNAAISATNAKASEDRAADILEEVENANVYRGAWDPTTNAYPPVPTTNSKWDVSLPGGTFSHTFDGIDWVNGDALVYLLDGAKFQAVKGAIGVSSVNNKTGAVTLGPADVGALPISGGIINGQLGFETGGGGRIFCNALGSDNKQIVGIGVGGDNKSIYLGNPQASVLVEGAGETFGFSGLNGLGSVYTTKFKPTALDVGALPITGGTLTGDLKLSAGASISGVGRAESMVSNTVFANLLCSGDEAWLGSNMYWDGTQWLKHDSSAKSDGICLSKSRIPTIYHSEPGQTDPTVTSYEIYTEANKPTYEEVGGNNYWIDYPSNHEYITSVRKMAFDFDKTPEIRPASASNGQISLGMEGMSWKEVWSQGFYSNHWTAFAYDQQYTSGAPYFSHCKSSSTSGSIYIPAWKLRHSDANYGRAVSMGIYANAGYPEMAVLHLIGGDGKQYRCTWSFTDGNMVNDGAIYCNNVVQSYRPGSSDSGWGSQGNNFIADSGNDPGIILRNRGVNQDWCIAQWGGGELGFITAPLGGSAANRRSATLSVDGVWSAYGFTNVSDIRKKENVEEISDCLNKVSELRGVSYNFIDNPEARKAGYIAQEVQRVLPEAISVSNDEMGTLTVDNSALIGLLIGAIQELKAEVDYLKNKGEERWQ